MIRVAVHRARRRLDRMLRPGGRGAVLLYHRVADEVSDPYGLCVSPDQFAEHLQVIHDIGRPMRVLDFANAVRSRSLPDRAICITFDDGYGDNLEQAEPLLAAHDVTALVFVTTGDGGRDREFWWDELERIFLQPGVLPEQLELEIESRPHAWRLGADATYTQDAQERHRGWHMLDAEAPTARHAVFREVYALIQPLATELRTRTLDALLAWAGCDGSVRPQRRVMLPAEVSGLAARGVLDVGAHTVNHPALPAQPVTVQRAEMVQSKSTLESWIGRQVHGFAYPYGLFDAGTVSAARDAGFAWACSGTYCPVGPGADLFALPRIEAPAVDGDELGRILRWQLH